MKKELLLKTVLVLLAIFICIVIFDLNCRVKRIEKDNTQNLWMDSIEQSNIRTRAIDSIYIAERDSIWSIIKDLRKIRNMTKLELEVLDNKLESQDSLRKSTSKKLLEW